MRKPDRAFGPFRPARGQLVAALCGAKSAARAAHVEGLSDRLEVAIGLLRRARTTEEVRRVCRDVRSLVEAIEAA